VGSQEKKVVRIEEYNNVMNKEKTNSSKQERKGKKKRKKVTKSNIKA
jgi:hypothetical protein